MFDFVFSFENIIWFSLSHSFSTHLYFSTSSFLRHCILNSLRCITPAVCAVSEVRSGVFNSLRLSNILSFCFFFFFEKVKQKASCLLPIGEVKFEFASVPCARFSNEKEKKRKENRIKCNEPCSDIQCLVTVLFSVCIFAGKRREKQNRTMSVNLAKLYNRWTWWILCWLPVEKEQLRTTMLLCWARQRKENHWLIF